MSAPEEIVHYIVVDVSLGASPGRLAAETARLAVRMSREVDKEPARERTYARWLAAGRPTVVLRGGEADIERLRRAGFPASEAARPVAVSLWPMTREGASVLVGRLHTLP